MMPLAPGWDDLAARIALTVMAGALIGVNRDPTREELVALAKAAGFAMARQAVTYREHGRGYELQL